MRPRWCWNESGFRSVLPGIGNPLLPFSSGTSRLSPAHTVQDALRESYEAKQAALEAHDKMLTFQKVRACAPLSVTGSTCWVLPSAVLCIVLDSTVQAWTCLCVGGAGCLP